MSRALILIAAVTGGYAAAAWLLGWLTDAGVAAAVSGAAVCWWGYLDQASGRQVV